MERGGVMQKVNPYYDNKWTEYRVKPEDPEWWVMAYGSRSEEAIPHMFGD